jgi:membrane-associated phospholipid phosphatase
MLRSSPPGVAPVAALAAVLAAALSVPARAAAQDAPRPLDVPTGQTWAVTGGATGTLLLVLAFQKQLAPSSCRWCASNGFDTSLRDALKWKDTGAASTGSDILQLGVPVLAVGGLVLSGLDAGARGRSVGQDLLVTAEATSVALLAMQIAKLSFGRVRPYAWADPGQVQGRDAYASFFSGHTTATFAVASAAGTVARLRGYRHWRWILGVGLTAAATTGYLRIAADRHWATDVIVGAAVGSLAGFGLPVWLHERAAATPTGATASLRPTLFGVSGEF